MHNLLAKVDVPDMKYIHEFLNGKTSLSVMKKLLTSSYSKSEKDYKVGITIHALNKMDM